MTLELYPTLQPVIPPLPDPLSYVKWTSRGADLKDKLTGSDTDAYFVWRFAVKSKLRVDTPLYHDEDLKIRYAMQQLDHPVFSFICSWFAKAKKPLLSDLFSQLEHYLGTKYLASKAEVELDDIQQEPNESTSAFYHRIQILWDRASTPLDLRYRMFVRKLKPELVDRLRAWIISQGDDHCDLSSLLDAARSAEGLQHEIDAFQKRRDPKNKRQYATSSSFAQTASTATTSTRYGDRRSSFSSSSSNPNAKLVPTASKLSQWVGQWYEPESNPK
ncbi:hypothetical protein KEM55_004561, partial [Ascosphaera atra]